MGNKRSHALHKDHGAHAKRHHSSCAWLCVADADVSADMEALQAAWKGVQLFRDTSCTSSTQQLHTTIAAGFRISMLKFVTQLQKSVYNK